MSRASGGWLLLLGALLAPVFLAAPGTVDLPIWLEWMGALRVHGLIAGYAAVAPEYPPLGFALLHATDQLAQATQASPFLVLKLTLLLMLYLTAGLVLAWTHQPRWAALVLFALLLDATAHGYLDIFGAPWLFAALWALGARRPLSAAALFSVSVLMKWQPLIALPFLLPCALGAGRSLSSLPQRLMALTLAALAPLLGCLAVFGLEPLTAFTRTLHHPQLSGNALNFNWLLTWMLHLLAPQHFGRLAQGRVFIIETHDAALLLAPRLLFALSYLAVLAYTWRLAAGQPGQRRWTLPLERALPIAALGYLSYFTFNPGVHENHLYVGMLLALACAWLAPAEWPMLAPWVVFENVNLVLFYGLDGTGLHFGRVAAGLDLSVLLAAFELALFGWSCWRLTHRRSAPAA